MKKRMQLLFAGLFFLGMAACDVNRVYDEYVPIKDAKWHKDSLVVFDIPITDTILNHNIFINVRNDINYSYSNLWLFVNIEQPDGVSLCDTFEVALADQSGQWLGKGFGGYKTRESVFRRNVYFPNSGAYKISIQQGMRELNLEGISDVGLRLEKMN